jgi:hypothetical protein
MKKEVIVPAMARLTNKIHLFLYHLNVSFELYGCEYHRATAQTLDLRVSHYENENLPMIRMVEGIFCNRVKHVHSIDTE